MMPGMAPVSPRRRSAPVASLLLRAFELVLVVHLAAQLFGADEVARWTQWLLMPLLAAHLAVATRAGRPRLVRLVLVGLVFSWLGDLLPHFSGDGSFLVMVGMFAVAQAAYALAFWPFRAASLLRSPWALAYAAVGVAMVVLCAPGAGPLLPAIVGYAVLITVMAVLATGVHLLAAIGGAVFVLSDSLIALEAFVPGWELPGQGFWVMLTYAVAQLLIVLGVLARVRAEGALTPVDGLRSVRQ